MLLVLTSQKLVWIISSLLQFHFPIWVNYIIIQQNEKYTLSYFVFMYLCDVHMHIVTLCPVILVCQPYLYILTNICSLMHVKSAHVIGTQFLKDIALIFFLLCADVCLFIY